MRSRRPCWSGAGGHNVSGVFQDKADGRTSRPFAEVLRPSRRSSRNWQDERHPLLPFVLSLPHLPPLAGRIRRRSKDIACEPDEMPPSRKTRVEVVLEWALSSRIPG